jgi:hypothetical protein
VWLDLAEVALRVIEKNLGRLDDYERSAEGIKTAPEDAVKELNERFRRAGFGYKYEGEFRAAHAHFKAGEFKDCTKPACGERREFGRIPTRRWTVGPVSSVTNTYPRSAYWTYFGPARSDRR